jgi:ATP-dependent Zn protease
MKKFLLFFGVVFGISLLILMNGPKDSEPTMIIDAEEALSTIDNGEITAWRFGNGGLELQFEGEDYARLSPPMDAVVLQKLVASEIPRMSARRSESQSQSSWIPLVITLVVVVTLFYFLLRRMGTSGTNSIFNLQKSKAREIEDVQTASFDDIGGNSEAIELFQDLVSFLADPAKWSVAGSRLPRGLLLTGPPGTGKTLTARALAGQAEAGFFYTSGSEFVELFVGVGASRIRDTFELAKAKQPAIIFIDELDAIGRRRGSGAGSIHEEREQTLNQLLVLMDGLDRSDRIIVVAATNRPDVLDPALLRSGRFDRRLHLPMPAEKDRHSILKIHTRAKPLHDDVCLETVARNTDGFSGADLENLTNEASLLAVRRARKDPSPEASIRLTALDFQQGIRTLTSTSRQFDKLDSILVESVTQFSEPTGRIVARVFLTSGKVIEGEMLWMNATHFRLRSSDGDVIVLKQLAERIEPLAGTESARKDDFSPDRLAGRQLEIGPA